ncbi:MAG: hypothetical protein ACI9UT_002628 [Flavobacteriales bacterium]|jgi:hypothetical protein
MGWSNNSIKLRPIRFNNKKSDEQIFSTKGDSKITSVTQLIVFSPT